MEGLSPVGTGEPGAAVESLGEDRWAQGHGSQEVVVIGCVLKSYTSGQYRRMIGKADDGCRQIVTTRVTGGRNRRCRGIEAATVNVWRSAGCGSRRAR